MANWDDYDERRFRQEEEDYARQLRLNAAEREYRSLGLGDYADECNRRAREIDNRHF